MLDTMKDTLKKLAEMMEGIIYGKFQHLNLNKGQRQAVYYLDTLCQMLKMMCYDYSVEYNEETGKFYIKPHGTKADEIDLIRAKQMTEQFLKD